MTAKGKTVTVHDMTLRDGMHPKRHLMSLDQMVSIATGLDAAGIPLIEVTHGDGLGGSSVNYGFPAHTDEEYLGTVIPKMKNAKVSALLLPGIGTVDHLKMARDLGVNTIRVATHCTEADVSEQHITMARKLGMDTVGFLMMSHMKQRRRPGQAGQIDGKATAPTASTSPTRPVTCCRKASRNVSVLCALPSSRKPNSASTATTTWPWASPTPSPPLKSAPTASMLLRPASVPVPVIRRWKS